MLFKRLHKLFPTLIYLVCGLLLVMFFQSATTLRLTDIHYGGVNQKLEKSNNFYYLEPIANTVDYSMTANLNYLPFSQTNINIDPDDCLIALKVNNQDVLNSKMNQPICGSERGYDLDLKPYLKIGSNQVMVSLHNEGGALGLYWQNSLSDPINFILILLTLILILAILSLLIMVIDSSPLITIFLLFGGFILRCIYLMYTRFNVREHDVPGHFQFVDYVQTHFRLPDINYCYQCHQKPLYYIISGIYLKIIGFFGFTNPFSSLQFLNLILFMFMMIFGLVLLKKNLKNKLSFLSAGLILVFWPSGIIHSIRISNDILYYFFYILGLLFINIWFRSKKNQFLIWGIIIALLGLLTKVNTIALLCLILILVIYRNRFNFKHLVVYFVGFLILMFLFLIPYVKQKQVSQTLLSRITRSDQIDGRLQVGNKPVNYLFFDLQTYMHEPFVSAWEDRTGRQYFWNYLIKSSLFGEFSFNKEWSRDLAVVMSFVALLMIGFSSLSIFFVNKKNYRAVAFFGLSLLLLLTMFIFYRIRFPAACNTDFRYIFPSLISFAFIYGFAIEKAGEKNLILVRYFGLVLAICLSLLVNVFFFVNI